MTTEAACRSCNDPIIFVVVANNAGRKPARMPLNPEPDETGNVAVLTTSSGGKAGRVLTKDQQPAPYEVLYQSHFATCPKADENRRRQRQGWKDAQAAHNASKRRQRGRTVQPELLPGMMRRRPE